MVEILVLKLTLINQTDVRLMNYTDKSKQSNKLYCISCFIGINRSTLLGNIIYRPMSTTEKIWLRLRGIDK